jgi:glycosyltransferase involved in cell wall biosynthesis
MENSKLNICIPNFNYARFLDQTLQSLSEQTDKNFRVYISDNASTDDSLLVIDKWKDKFDDYRLNVNKTNLGFGGNLDKVTQNLSSGFTIMLSSDDIVLPSMIEIYNRFINVVERIEGPIKFLFGSPPVKIDENNKVINTIQKDKLLWFEDDLHSTLSAELGYKVYRVSSKEMLNRCLKNYKTSLHFITTCYHSSQIQEIGPYGNARMYNPDKWFNWRLLSNSDYIYFIDADVFQYRWHSQNQFALQNNSSVLKYWIDEYRNSFEANDSLIKIAGISKEENIEIFLNKCIYAYIIHHLILKDYLTASRIFAFGVFTYYFEMKRSKYYYPIKVCLSNRMFMVLGSIVLGLIYIAKKKNIY